VILVDANLLLYAEDSLSAHHEVAREWWDSRLSGSSPVCLCWTVVNAFIRISTNPRIFEQPLSLNAALDRVHSWFAQPCVRLICATERHWPVFKGLLLEGQAHGNLVADAHIAALAMQHGCILMSSNADFARFDKLRWTNPLNPKASTRRR
jgi:toxin-antitoxin system PIN domain toxin